MVKYFQFDSIDEYGVHITPLEPGSNGLVKLASNNYSKEIVEAIAALKRESQYYYVVINALGSYEVWGANRNGDAFPREGLSHYSLRSDMGTDNDYGYKTFEYYGNLFKNHCNKPDSPKFGKVLFSHWNPRIDRVELIVGIDKFAGKDIIEAIENGDLISVSMGAKLKFDECNICGNKSKKVKDYCKHLKKYMGKIVTKDLADLWSVELKKQILPGTMVFAWNHHPRFFDISKVYVGAEPVAYLLGKVASQGDVIPSAYIAEAEGVTDEMIDKLSAIGKAGILKKNADIDKEFGGSDQGEIDGKVIAKGKADAIRKVLDEKLQTTIPKEESIPNPVLDLMAKNVGLSNIFSTMMGLGIHPKPAEFQRIVIIKIGRPDIANFLDNNNMIFDPNAEVEPIDIPIGREHFDDNLARILSNYLEKRSCFPDFLEPRLNKIAGIEEVKRSINPSSVLIGLTALFAGLKMKSMGMGAQQMLDTFRSKPWIGTLLGAGLAYKLLSHDRGKELDKILVPANRYQDALANTYFSGHIKTASVGTSLALGALAGVATLPAAYILNAYHRKSMYEQGQPLFPGSGVSPVSAAKVIGGGTALASLVKENYGKEIMNKIKSLK